MAKTSTRNRQSLLGNGYSYASPWNIDYTTNLIAASEAEMNFLPVPDDPGKYVRFSPSSIPYPPNTPPKPYTPPDPNAPPLPYPRPQFGPPIPPGFGTPPQVATPTRLPKPRPQVASTPPLKKAARQIRLAIGKAARQRVGQGSSGSGSGTRGSTGYGSSYGAGGYQGGVYGGAGGSSINQGVGGAYKNR